MASIILIIGLLLFGGCIALQIWLSLRESPRLGLILPGISLLVSVLFVLNMAMLPGDGNGTVQVLAALGLYNIPTVVFLLIHFICRDHLRRRQKRQMERMNIQDL